MLCLGRKRSPAFSDNPQNYWSRPVSGRAETTPMHTIRRLVVGPRGPDNPAVADESSEKFLIHLRAAMGDGSLTRLTLGSHRGADPTLRRLVVRPVVLQAGPRFAL